MRGTDDMAGKMLKKIRALAAGTGTADSGSLRTAIDYAADLALRTRR
jgi:hypothetical protein